MQNISSLTSPSAKSAACHTQDFSFPECSWTVIVGRTVQTKYKEPTKSIQIKAEKGKPRLNEWKIQIYTMKRNKNSEKGKRKPTQMISADLESLRLPHNKTNFSSVFMFQQLHTPGASLLPLISILIEPIKLSFPKIEHVKNSNQQSARQKP